MFPWLIAAAATAAAAYVWHLLKRLFKNKTQEDDSRDDQSEKDIPRNDSGNRNSGLVNQLRRELENGQIVPTVDKSGLDQYLLPEKYDPIRPLWESILKIVNQITFFEKRLIIEKKIGEVIKTSQIPTGDIQIKPMQSIAELPNVMTSNLGLEDDIFYPMLANSQLLIQQAIEYEGVYQQKYIRPRKVLRALQDVSGSEKGDRIAWSRLLDQLLIEKAKKSNADATLTTFTDKIGPTFNAVPELSVSYSMAGAFIDQYIRADGGTSINNALNHELNLVEAENTEVGLEQSTVIVLITDGTEGVDEKLILEKMEKNNVALHTVILGVEHPQLKRISTKYNFLDIPAVESLWL